MARKKMWKPTVIKGKKMQEIAAWLNCWADFNKHPECVDGKYTTEYGKGYNQAVSDIYNKLGLDFR